MLKTGSVAAGSIEAVESAIHILKEGGNAVDAAVAAIFSSMTSEFSLTGAAGGGAITLSIYGEKPITIDFFVDAIPKRDINSIEFLKKKVNFGDATQIFRIGKGSIAVPGTIQGLLYAHNRYGKIPLEAVLEPGINYAKSGVILNNAQSYIFKLLEPIFSHDLKNNTILFKNNKILQEGDLFKNEIFSDFLFELSREGLPFYINDGLKILDRFLEKDALFGIKEMLSYRVVERPSISSKINGYDFFSNPGPSFGGTLIVYCLELLKKVKQKRLNSDILVKVFQATENMRTHVQRNKLEIRDILTSNMIERGLNIVNNFSIESIKDIKNNGFGSTTQVSIIDKYSNCVSATTTNGEGCGYIVPELGIMMNNMMGEEDLNPNGFHTYKTRQRLSTMMAPSIIFKDKKPSLVIGSGGSNRLRSAIIQVLVNYCLKDISLSDSISLERLYIEDGSIFLEKNININSKILDLYNKIVFNEKNLFFGGVNAVSLNEAFGDKRRDGSSIYL